MYGGAHLTNFRLGRTLSSRRHLLHLGLKD
jgi:hypothetical protein